MEEFEETLTASVLAMTLQQGHKTADQWSRYTRTRVQHTWTSDTSISRLRRATCGRSVFITSTFRPIMYKQEQRMAEDKTILSQALPASTRVVY
jgi:hypothetical protein